MSTLRVVLVLWAVALLALLHWAEQPVGLDVGGHVCGVHVCQGGGR